MKHPNFSPVDLDLTILSVFDIGGMIPTGKDGFFLSSGLEYDMNQLRNDYLIIVEDYKRSTSKLCTELEETLNKKK